MLRRWLWPALALVVMACARAEPVELGTLVLQDSTYLDPATHEPYSGPVVRHFARHPEKVQLEGVLQRGTWEGEMTVYHESGRIRYQGRLSGGAPCGAWVENQSDEKAESVLEELTQQINSMGLYPPCPGEK